MNHVFSILYSRKYEIEDEIKRIKSLPNKNKEVFIVTQERFLIEVDRAIEILTKELSLK